MRKIAVSLFKGGVGKTTTSINLAHALARRGRRVLLVDCDTQGQAAGALGLDRRPGLAELALGEVPLDEALIPARDNLALLSGGQALAGLKRLIDRKEFAGERTLAETLEPCEGRFDYVLVDTAPGYDTLTINVLFYASEVLAPVSMEVLTLRGLADFQQSLERIGDYHGALRLAYVVPTFYDRRVRKSAEIMEQLQSRYSDIICPPIRYSVRLSESFGFGQTIFEYAPQSSGAGDYQSLCERIDGRG
jgi:chromosome partitioning protein